MQVEYKTTYSDNEVEKGNRYVDGEFTSTWIRYPKTGDAWQKDKYINQQVIEYLSNIKGKETQMNELQQNNEATLTEQVAELSPEQKLEAVDAFIEVLDADKEVAVQVEEDFR